MKRAWVLLCLVAVAIAPIAQADERKAQTAPGSYKGWGPDIDEIEIVKTFAAKDYEKIVVLPFDTSKIDVKDDKKGVVIQGALDGYTAVFVEGLRADLKSGAKVELGDPSKAGAARTLLVRGVVEEISPGSRTKRYVAGFGAGAARNKVSVELVDAASGEVLVRFTQAHRSAGTFKFAGGTDAQVLRDGTRAMGEDTAHIIDAF